uniref:Uncharacterized protein n=1 Tax=Eutreptiella gymnastica TaxID=73025 RepID=A0A7S1N235_9EUGL
MPLPLEHSFSSARSTGSEVSVTSSARAPLSPRKSIADFKSKSPQKKPPSYGIYDPLLSAVASGKTENVKQVWSEGYAVREHLGTALHNAFVRQNMDIVRCLVQIYKADINTPNANGQALIHLACRANNIQLMHEVYEQDADMDATEENTGWTPLHIACSKGNHNMVCALVDRGANPIKRATVADADGIFLTPLELAQKAGSEEVIDYLTNETHPELLEWKQRKKKCMAKLEPGGRAVVQDTNLVSSPVKVTAMSCRLATSLPEPVLSNVQRIPLSNDMLYDEFCKMSNGSNFVLKEDFKSMYKMMEDFGLPIDLDKIMKDLSIMGADRLSFDEYCVVRLKIAQK